MFNNSNIAIIDVGSDKIFAAVGEITKDKLFRTDSYADVNYDGFMDGDWVQGDDVAEAVTNCLNKALYGLNVKLAAVYVGVPGNFAKAQVCSNRMNFGAEHKISENDLQYIQDNTGFRNDGRYEVISQEVIDYVLDGREKSLSPVGKSCFNLGVNLSFNLCKKDFCNLFRTILSDYTRKVKFVPGSLATALIATDREIRLKNSAVFVDIGYLTTDISYVMGGGLVDLHTLPFGGGHIAYDLAYGLNVPYSTACYIKSKVDFNRGEGDICLVQDDGEQKFEQSYVNMIAEARLEEIADNITKIINNYHVEYPSYLKIYLSGRGIADIQGVRALLAKALNRQCDLISPYVGGGSKSKVTLSTAALIQHIVSTDKPKKGLLSRFTG